MASGTNKKGTGRARDVSASVAVHKPKPWGTIIAVIAVLALAGGVLGYAFLQVHDKAVWTPSDDNKDPSLQLPGIVHKQYASGMHVQPTQRVAYDQSPPFGGPHDGFWADCDGLVYPKAVRNENMVHALEHGTVWIAYNPDKVKGADLDKLKALVVNQPFMMLSPYPGLDHPVSLQSWGHQLKVDSVTDDRIGHFITALKRNQYAYPEVGASCDALGAGQFDPDNPPPFDPSPPGKDAVPMTGGTNSSQQEMNGQTPSAVPPTGSAAGTVPATAPASGAPSSSG